MEFVDCDKMFCSKGMQQKILHAVLMSVLSPLSADYFIGFGKCLGKDEVELGKVWDEALGRYDRAVLNLVVGVLQEAQNPAEKLYYALEEMRTPQSAKRASEAIQYGKLQYS